MGFGRVVIRPGEIQPGGLLYPYTLLSFDNNLFFQQAIWAIFFASSSLSRTISNFSFLGADKRKVGTQLGSFPPVSIRSRFSPYCKDSFHVLVNFHFIHLYLLLHLLLFSITKLLFGIFSEKPSSATWVCLYLRITVVVFRSNNTGISTAITCKFLHKLWLYFGNGTHAAILFLVHFYGLSLLTILSLFVLPFSGWFYFWDILIRSASFLLRSQFQQIFVSTLFRNTRFLI